MAEIVSTAANIGGIGLGPLITGFLAESAQAPLYTPYVVFAFLLVVTVPETVRGVDTAWRYRPQRMVVPHAALGQYVAAALMAFVGFAVFGFFTSLARPSSFTSAAAFQIVSSRWARSRQVVIGLILLAAGGIAAGAGVDITFKSAVGTVTGISPAEVPGEALARLFLAGHVGMALPVVVLGLMLQGIPLVPSVMAFGAIMLALVAVTALCLARTHRCGPAAVPAP